jgi:uncharacterized protein (DUF362 family)
MQRISRREWLRRIGIPFLGAIAVACRSRVSPLDSESTPTTGAPIPTKTSLPATAVAAPTEAVAPPPSPVPAGSAYLAVARGSSPAANVEAALRAIGGIERFVQPGNDVIVKPNICVAYHTPEYAATTNPEVVSTLVRLCLGAGARRVRVMDQPFGGSADEAYRRSGIADAVESAGGTMEIMSGMKFATAAIPAGQDIKEWSVYRDALDADVLINVPIAKTHDLAVLTLGMKNLMGLVEDRGGLHPNLAQRLADLTSLFRPALTVVDATRILVANGPSGGNLEDVRQTQTLIASHDVVAADAFAATLFGLTAADVPATAAGAAMGLGTLDLAGIRIEEISTG